jgi:hypothetical protein
MALALVFLLPLLTARAADEGLADIQKTFDSGDYRGTLQKISRALSMTQTPPPADDRYTLLMLRGESLLRLGERTYAVDAFNAASRAAAHQRIKDAALAKANAVVITRSQGPVYKPAGGDGDGINIVNPATRTKAMGAAFDDMLRLNMPKFKAALEGKQLPPMLSLVPVLGDMYVLETAASGEPRRTTEILKSFGEHARVLMNNELARVDKRVQALSNLANSISGIDSNWGGGINTIDRRGLWTPERNELEDLMQYTRQIAQAARKAREISVSFGYTGENWDPVIADADGVIDREEELWQHRY